MLADRVLRTVRTFDLIPPGGRVVAAVSGGSDSVALACLLGELAARGELVLAGLAHLHHGLRGPAADADEAFCRAFAAARGLPIDVERADVRALARGWRTSIEDAARRARRAFFERAAARAGAASVAVGHTRDDQAETFLLRLVRGAGTRGLAAIHPRAGVVVRPLLEIGRAELRDDLDARGQAFCEDETNRDLSIPRNRVRHELLPYLARHFSPGIVDVLAREARLAREDADWLDRAAIEIAPTLVLCTDQGADLDVVALRALPPALAGRVVRGALTSQAGGRFIGFEHVEALLALARESGAAHAAVDLPGQHVARHGDCLRLRPQGPRRAAAAGGANSFRYSLSIPGEVDLAEVGWTISAEWGADVRAGSSGITNLSARGTSVAVAAVAGPLAVRTRRPGDAFRPLGLGGRKKLQDFFVDRKVARAERDRIPLVVDVSDRIVWVVGQAVAEDFRVTAPAQGVILLKARRLGGHG